MRDSPEGGELDSAAGVRRRCKKNSITDVVSNIALCVGKLAETALVILLAV